MRRAYGVGVILLLALGAFAAPLGAQTQGSTAPPGSRERGFRLEQNFPNPFNPHTTIPFYLNEELFEDGQSVRVTIRIYNVLQQLVAIPVALDHPGGGRAPMLDLVYTTAGAKAAFWDGLDREGRRVASGIYYLQMQVNGMTMVRKMVVAK